MNKVHLKFWGFLQDLFDKHRSLISFILVVIGIILLNFILNQIVSPLKIDFFSSLVGDKSQTFIDFAPEVWLGLLSLVLGTLIIVISIASQSTPKLIDLYIKDLRSIFYMWFITVSATHNLWLQLSASSGYSGYEANILLNTYVFLPLGLILALPYILYILKYTTPGNVIEKIFKENLNTNRLLKDSSYQFLLNNPHIVERYQFKMFEALNQLDDLLEYVEFKEPKGDIIQKMGISVRNYVNIKDKINPNFFKICKKIRNDISFKTLSGQFEEIEESKTFYEHKAFRLLGNAYFKLIENNDFDLASQCVYEIAKSGKTAIENNDDELLEVITIKMNTIFRFGIKHGLKNHEVRNIYNALFHYSELIGYQIASKKTKQIERSCKFLEVYGTEIFKHSRTEASFTFLVDVFALELKKALIRLNEAEYNIVFQNEILSFFLNLDNSPDVSRDELGQTRIKNDGVRVLQVGLSLYYLKHNKNDLTQRIIDDIFEDFEHLGKDLKSAVEFTCSKLKVFTPTFWEDTDRGNVNLYYANEKDQIPLFLKMFNEQWDKLMKSKVNRY